MTRSCLFPADVFRQSRINLVFFVFLMLNGRCQASSLTNMQPLADWNLPPGVNRGLWDYVHDADLARQYDQVLAGTPLLAIDLAFAARHFPAPGRLLDLGCGTGRLLLPFAQRGFWGVGVDLSAEMLRIVGEKSAAAGVSVHRLQANLVVLDGLADASFDYAACLFSTLGMIRGDQNRRQVITHVHRLLRPGGIFVLHVHNRWFSLWDRAGRRWLARDVLGLRAAGEEKGTRPMPAHRGIAGLALHHYTRREVVQLLERQGLEVFDVQPVGLGSDGRLAATWCFGGLRAYGYLLAARKAHPLQSGETTGGLSTWSRARTGL
jgi:SAM-dependent methyltransferase